MLPRSVALRCLFATLILVPATAAQAAPKVSHLQVAAEDLVTLLADVSPYGTGVAFNQRLFPDGAVEPFFKIPPDRCLVLLDVAWNVVQSPASSTFAYELSVGSETNPGPNGLFQVARWDVTTTASGEGQGVEHFAAGIVLGTGRAFFVDLIGPPPPASGAGSAFGYLIHCN